MQAATQAAYAQGIEPAIGDTGYRAMRIDKKEHSHRIDDEIIAEAKVRRYSRNQGSVR